MKPTTFQVLEMENFFNQITIPQVVKINASTTFTDAPKFVVENIGLLKDRNLNDLTATTRYQMLVDLKAGILEPVK